MHANDIREERRREDHEYRGGHESHRGAVLNRTGVLREPPEGAAHGDKEEERPCDGGEEDPERAEARGGVDERHGEGEERPADDVVPDAGGEHDDADGGVDELELGEDTIQDGEGGDGEGDAGEEHKVRVGDARVDVPVVDRDREGGAEGGTSRRGRWASSSARSS